MTIGGCTDLDSTVAGLMHLRTYAPYRYGGTWFVAFVSGTGYAYRSQAPLLRKAREANLNNVSIATIAKQKDLPCLP